MDIYGNDLSNIDDNCIEADGAAHNVRVFQNRCFNVATGGISTQPIFGGPAYIYRNIVYNGLIGGPLKFVDTPAGVLVYQNTFIGQGRLFGPVSNTHFRNNLFLGDGWNDMLFNFSTFTNYSTSDYNGFRPNPGAKLSFEWSSPAFGTAADFGGAPVFGGSSDYRGELVQRRYATLKAYASATGQDRHSRLLDYDALTNVPPPDRATCSGCMIPPPSISGHGQAGRRSMAAWCCRRSPTASPDALRIWALMKRADPSRTMARDRRRTYGSRFTRTGDAAAHASKTP